MSHVAPRLTPLGKNAAGTFSPRISPLTPEGPSETYRKVTSVDSPVIWIWNVISRTLREGMPSQGLAAACHCDLPAKSESFSSKVNCDSMREKSRFIHSALIVVVASFIREPIYLDDSQRCWFVSSIVHADAESSFLSCLSRLDGPRQSTDTTQVWHRNLHS